jgi:proteasome lid subunit RPN8/RPN11
MIHLSAAQREAIERHGEETYPHECCGFLLGKSDGSQKRVLEVRRAGNARDDSPQNRYLIPAIDMLHAERDARARDLEILGFYHSHPDVAARPSDYDREHAWPWYTYVIVSVRQGKAVEMNAWSLAEDRGRFDAEPIGGTDAGAGG